MVKHTDLWQAMTSKRKTNSYLESVLWFIKAAWKVSVQILPFKDTYTGAVSCQWHQGQFTSSQRCLYTCPSQNHARKQDKAWRGKMDAVSFSLHPVPENVKARALPLGFTSATLFATCKTTPSLEEAEGPTRPLSILPSNRYWRWDRVKTLAEEGFANRELWSSRRKITGTVCGLA